MSVHGGDGRLVARSLGLDPVTVLDLSASANPFAPDPAPLVQAAIERGALTRYPDDGDRGAATRSLAGALGVDPRRVLVTNGGAEAIALVATELRTGWVEEPDFSLYARHLEAVEPGAPRFASDPRNPTGRLAAPGEQAAVWDEAFYPLATGEWTNHERVATVAGAPVVVGSLTKVLGCPGLRLGYVAVPDDDGAALGVSGLIGRLARRQPQWAVSTVALEVLPAMVEHADLGAWASAIATCRAQLADLLAANGYDVGPSDANFVLVHDAGDLRERLAARGVVVRDCASFGLGGCVRIAVPDARGLERLAGALGDGSAR